MTNTTHTMVQIECSCATCATNAATLGKSLPLRAEVTESMKAILKGKFHGAVELAHHPVLGGRNPLVRAL